ncbi:hypothetical protein BU16DRAFT_167189 [Lophium mytilinum]|uniref:Uncharacterized protein n=1 Tax=Lophium mytilinum TaxID=390894 RepID=A0A6A6QE30_9PEZI|nr:hypothetical protein BU16DRAFT_167189 [Lophium mytilinum]
MQGCKEYRRGKRANLFLLAVFRPARSPSVFLPLQLLTPPPPHHISGDQDVDPNAFMRSLLDLVGTTCNPKQFHVSTATRRHTPAVPLYNSLPISPSAFVGPAAEVGPPRRPVLQPVYKGVCEQHPPGPRPDDCCASGGPTLFLSSSPSSGCNYLRPRCQPPTSCSFLTSCADRVTLTATHPSECVDARLKGAPSHGPEGDSSPWANFTEIYRRHLHLSTTTVVRNFSVIVPGCRNAD